jgi:hypothetical protein
MGEPADSGNNSRVQNLEAELLAMQRQVELRDELLHVLNRRLLQLERGELDAVAMKQIKINRRKDNNLRRALRSVLDTGLFRWTAPARRIHGKLYERRQASP